MPYSHSALQRFANRLLARSTLTQEEVDAVLGLQGTAHQARANKDIVRPGEVVQDACLIVAGLAGQCEQMGGGIRQITALHIPGDMCDLHSVVVPRANWHLQALTTTTYLRIPHSEVRRVAREHPRLAEAFWRDSVVDAAMVAQWVINVGRRDSKRRFAHFLCETGLRMEHAEVGRRDSFTLDMTQAHLGDILAISAVHVNRTMQSFRQANLISTQGRHFTVPDWDRLARLGDFNPDYLQIHEQPVPRALAFA